MVRLTILQGEEAGDVFLSREASITIGTATDNQFRLTDPFISRHHAEICEAADGWVYRDLKSTNGSIIERGEQQLLLGEEKSEYELCEGDLLLLGKTVICFQVEPAEQQAVESGLIASRNLEDLVKTGIRKLESLEDLAAAYQLEREISFAFGAEDMLDAILEGTLKAFPAATHTILLLVDKKSGHLKRQIARVRGEEGRAQREIPVSMTVAARVLEEGKALLFQDVAGEFKDSQSVISSGIVSSICVPLWTGEETVGLILVDNRGGKRSFTERDLDRLCMFANRAALAILASELCDAEQSNRLLRDLSAMITHDLKGPLTTIMGFLELLSQEQLAEHQKEYVEIALADGKWLSVLIAGILDAAKMEAGEIKLNLETIEVRENIEQALDLIAYQLREKGIRLQVSVDPRLSALQVDKELFRRIIVNLAGNAVKFAPEGSRIMVAAELGAEGDLAVLSVRDEGPGIAKEHQERIFDKFVRVATGKSSEKISVGLGLAFCKLAVEAHGGTIWVESEPGRGACFFFTLPLKQADGTEVPR